MNKLFALISRFFNRWTRPVESFEEDSITRHAKLGDMMAQYTLAFMYEKGRGRTQSTSKAKQWYRKSAEQGHMGAKQKLMTLRKD